jgi:hypothetical protein
MQLEVPALGFATMYGGCDRCNGLVHVLTGNPARLRAECGCGGPAYEPPDGIQGKVHSGSTGRLQGTAIPEKPVGQNIEQKDPA